MRKQKMDNKESLYNAYLEAKKQVEIYTDKMLQLKDTFKVLHSKFIVGETVFVSATTKCIVESISVKEEFSKLECHYTLRKIKADGTPSQHLWNRYFTIREQDIKKV